MAWYAGFLPHIENPDAITLFYHDIPSDGNPPVQKRVARFPNHPVVPKKAIYFHLLPLLRTDIDVYKRQEVSRLAVVNPKINSRNIAGVIHRINGYFIAITYLLFKNENKEMDCKTH